MNKLAKNPPVGTKAEEFTKVTPEQSKISKIVIRKSGGRAKGSRNNLKKSKKKNMKLLYIHMNNTEHWIVYLESKLIFLGFWKFKIFQYLVFLNKGGGVYYRYIFIYFYCDNKYIMYILVYVCLILFTGNGPYVIYVIV